MLEGGDERSSAMTSKSSPAVNTMGIDIGKNSFHVIGLDERGAIVLRQKWSRGQLEARLANTPPCLIGMVSDFSWNGAYGSTHSGTGNCHLC
jgi:transposase